MGKTEVTFTAFRFYAGFVPVLPLTLASGIVRVFPESTRTIPGESEQIPNKVRKQTRRKTAQQRAAPSGPQPLYYNV